MMSMNSKSALGGKILALVVYLFFLYGIAKIFVAHRLIAVEVPAGMDSISYSRGASAASFMAGWWAIGVFVANCILNRFWYKYGKATAHESQ